MFVHQVFLQVVLMLAELGESTPRRMHIVAADPNATHAHSAPRRLVFYVNA